MATRSTAAKGPAKRRAPNRHRCPPPATDHSPSSNHDAQGEQSAITKGTHRADHDQKKGENPNKILPSHPVYHVSRASIIKNTTHRDGALYRRIYGFLTIHGVADRRKTQLEPTDCRPDRERCTTHRPTTMLQVFSLRLAKAPADMGPVQLYGYLAVRDCRDNLLNYVFNRGRDDPLVVRQGCLVEMTGPKRSILMVASPLVEFDMRIRSGEGEEDDLQLIDGAIGYTDLDTPLYPFTNRISGDSGAVDITLALFDRAVEASIDFAISEVESGFDLSLSMFVFIDGLHEIPLFGGAIGEPCGLRRYVVAVNMDTTMHLRFKILGQNGSANDDLDQCCSFEANTHGCACQQIMFERASISMKVTWSTIPIFS